MMTLPKFQLFRNHIGSTLSSGELGYRFGENAAHQILVLRAAIFEMHADPNDFSRARNASLQKFPIASADLMPEFEGAALGKKLQELEKRWIDSEFKLSRAELLS